VEEHRQVVIVVLDVLHRVARAELARQVAVLVVGRDEHVDKRQVADSEDEGQRRDGVRRPVAT
jgi:hypothetical protein